MNMRELVKNFDLNAAFKALDELDYPTVAGLKPTQPIKENMSIKRNLGQSLIEEFYNIDDSEDVAEAKEVIDDANSSTKLKKIQVIVDNIEASYAGKMIVRCLQCQEFFYKDKADINLEGEEANSIPEVGNIVNKGEKCQHCGFEGGYEAIGWVSEEEPKNQEELPAEDESETALPQMESDITEEDDVMIPEESGNGEEQESTDASDELNGLADEIAAEAEDEPTEEEQEETVEDEEDVKKKEESFSVSGQTVLTEGKNEQKLMDIGGMGQDELVSKFFSLDSKLEKKYGDSVDDSVARNQRTESLAMNEQKENIFQDDPSCDSGDVYQDTCFGEIPYDDIDGIDSDSIQDKISKYLGKVYKHFVKFVIVDANLDLDNAKLFVSGVIDFSSGRQLKSEFEFCPIQGVNDCTGRATVVGTCPEIVPYEEEIPYSATCSMNGNNLCFESFEYGYQTKSGKLVEGIIK